MLRWLLPVVTLLALLGQAVTAYAAAGIVGDASCCCPVKAKCKCHDHEGKQDAQPTLKRCAGEARLVAPAVAHALPAVELVVLDERRVIAASTPAPLPILDDVSREPEKPPF